LGRWLVLLAAALAVALAPPLLVYALYPGEHAAAPPWGRGVAGEWRGGWHRCCPGVVHAVAVHGWGLVHVEGRVLGLRGHGVVLVEAGGARVAVAVRGCWLLPGGRVVRWYEMPLPRAGGVLDAWGRLLPWGGVAAVRIRLPLGWAVRVPCR